MRPGEEASRSLRAFRSMGSARADETRRSRGGVDEARRCMRDDDTRICRLSRRFWICFVRLWPSCANGPMPMTIWNTLDVPLEHGWQCALIPAPQYARLMAWGYRDLTARSLYRRAGRERWPFPSNSLEPDEREKRRKWEDDVKRQLADDRRAFTYCFHPRWDLRSITGGNALHEVQIFLRDALGVAHWNQPTDNAGIRRMLCDSFQLAKTPNEGEPGTWYTNPGSGQMRLYGGDGKPVVDFGFWSRSRTRRSSRTQLEY